MVAECNDDRKVEDKTLKMDLIEKKTIQQVHACEGSPQEETLSKILSNPGGAPSCKAPTADAPMW